MKKLVLLSLPVFFTILIASFYSTLSLTPVPSIAHITINEGESTAITIGGSEYTVGVSGVSDNDTAVITVNGVSKVLDQGETKGFNGLDVYLSAVYYYPKEGQISYVELEISESTTTANKTCTDSDGGLDYYTKGTVAVCTFTETGGGCGGLVDYCSGNLLTEGYCEGTESKTVKYECPYGCEDGACISKKIISLLDASCKDSTITVTIENDGTEDIEVSDILFYVNDEPITNPGCDKTIISPGEFTICDSIPGVQAKNELFIPVKGYSNAISTIVYCAGENSYEFIEYIPKYVEPNEKIRYTISGNNLASMEATLIEKSYKICEATCPSTTWCLCTDVFPEVETGDYNVNVKVCYTDGSCTTTTEGYPLTVYPYSPIEVKSYTSENETTVVPNEEVDIILEIHNTDTYSINHVWVNIPWNEFDSSGLLVVCPEGWTGTWSCDSTSENYDLKPGETIKITYKNLIPQSYYDKDHLNFLIHHRDGGVHSYSAEFTVIKPTTTMPIVTTTMPIVPCSPCFSYFVFIDYYDGVLKLRNGPVGINNINVRASPDTSPLVSTSKTSAQSGEDLTITGVDTSGDIIIIINYRNVESGVYHSDSATIHQPTSTKLNIQITSPKDEQIVSGTVTVVAEASSTNELGQMNLGIQREGENVAKAVIFTTCGGSVACPVGGGDCIRFKSCNYDWNISGYDGGVFLTATITDGYNNKASDSIKVNVINYEYCSEQCRLRGYRYGSCKTYCEGDEYLIGISECPDKTNCCCAGKTSCPYECCVNDPDYLDKSCPRAVCPECVAGEECPPCIQPKCIDYQCVWYQQQEFVLKFKAGWNMFSFPVDVRRYLTATNQTTAKEVTVEKTITGKVTEVGQVPPTEVIEIPSERQCPSPAHVWHYSNGRYIDVLNDPDSIVNGWGYWVKMEYDCIAKVKGNKITIDDFPELNAGWNQIGAPSEAVNFYSVIGNCNLKSGPWWYDSSSKKYEKVRVLKPGEGYFVKVKDKCSLGSEIPPLPPEELGWGKAFRVG